MTKQAVAVVRVGPTGLMVAVKLAVPLYREREVTGLRAV